MNAHGREGVSACRYYAALQRARSVRAAAGLRSRVDLIRYARRHGLLDELS